MLIEQVQDLKIQLIETAILALNDRISNAEKAMKDAQESANQEEKSSAGDKYETGRAMGQLQRDMNAKQCLLAKKELTFLQQLNIKPKNQVGAGAVVKTNNGMYFISIGLGSVDSSLGKVHLISAESPIGKAMQELQINSEFKFNELSHTIEFIA
jgi:transcription elongation GreA/GreB family factor